MQLHPLTLLLAGAGLANAAPISIMISTTEVSSFRFGHAADNARTQPPAPFMHSEHFALSESGPNAGRTPGRIQHFCSGMKDGVYRLVQNLGLVDPRPITEPVHVWSHSHHDHSDSTTGEEQDEKDVEGKNDEHESKHDDRLAIVKFRPSFTGEHEHKMEGGMMRGGGLMRPSPQKGHHHMQAHQEQDGHRVHHHGWRHHPHCHHRGAFLARIHRALMSLGPWEGRAVAFVLGCGIGVLLRMFWVLAILAIRVVRGTASQSESDVIHHEVIFTDAEEIAVPPPKYTIDEKVPLDFPQDKKEDETKA